MDSRGRYTWGRRGFAGAAITGGMLGVSGASGIVRTLSQPSSGDADNGFSRAVAPQRLTEVGATSARYSAPPHHAGSGSGEYQLAGVADQALPDYPAGPVHVPYQASVGDASAGGFGGAPSQRATATEAYSVVPSGAHAAPKHSAPEFGQGSGYLEGNRLGGITEQTVGLSGNEPGPASFDIERTVGLSEERRDREPAVGPAGSGSDGYLAGNVTALAVNPSTVMGGTAAEAMDPAAVGLGTGFGTYGATTVDAGRSGSRHARPEPGEPPLGCPATESDTVGMAPAGPASVVMPSGPVPLSTAEPHYPGQPLARQHFPESGHTDVQHSGAHHAPGASAGPDQPARPAQFVDSETSALGSLDSSALFGSLSSPPR